MYNAIIEGTVFSPDPIKHIAAYAKATFTDLSIIHFANDPDNDKALVFEVRKPQQLSPAFTLREFQEGLITGDDRNIEWLITLSRGVE